MHLPTGGGTFIGAASSHHSLGSAPEHVLALCVEAARPGDWASHPHIHGGSPDSVPRVATTPCIGNVHSQGTNFYGTGDSHASSRYTRTTLSLSYPDVAHLQTCMYESHPQPCHLLARPALATIFQRVPKGKALDSTFMKSCATQRLGLRLPHTPHHTLARERDYTVPTCFGQSNIEPP